MLVRIAHNLHTCIQSLTCARTSDVGGSAVPDSQIHALSNISLRWMVREVMKAQCGIQFDEQALARASIPNFLMKHTTPHDEQLKLDAADASDPIHDELKINPVWWILEILPTHYSWQDDQGVWHKEWKCVIIIRAVPTCGRSNLHLNS